MTPQEEMEMLRLKAKARSLAAQQGAPQSAPPQRGNALDAVDAFTDRAANAALFNFGDELSAGLGAATIGTIGGGINAIKRGSLAEIPKAQRQTFQEFRDIHRDKRAEQQQLAPRAALAGDIVGGVVGGGKATAAAQKAFGGAVNTARGAGLVGAGEGAVFATGGAEGNLLERADDAAMGAVIGGLGGFGIQKVANGLRSFFTDGRKQLTAPKELREGIRIVQKRLAADLGGDDKARAFLKDWAARGGDGQELARFMAETNGQSASFLRAVGDLQPGKAFQFVEDSKAALKQATTDRVQSISRQSMGGVMDDLIEVRKTQAAPLYDEALSQRVFTKDIADLIESRPALKLAISAAKKQIKDRGATTTYSQPVMGKNPGGGRKTVSLDDAPTIEVIDRAKKILDTRIGSLRRVKPNDPRIGDLVIAKNALLQRIDELNPTYAQARRTFAGTAEIEDAMDIGLRASKSTGRTLPWRVFQQEVQDLQSRGRLSELEFARVGFAQGMLDEIDNAVDGRDINKLIRNEDMRQKIRILFADAPDEAEKFIQFIREGRDSFDSLSHISPRHNSQTVGRAQGLADFEAEFDGPVTQVADAFEKGGLTGGTTSALRKTVGAITRQRRAAISKQVADVMAEFLFTPGGSVAPDLLVPPALAGRLPVAQSGVAAYQGYQPTPAGPALNAEDDHSQRLRFAQGTRLPR